MPTARTSVPPRRPLFVTADPLLLDELLRLSAAAGVEALVAADAGAARPAWSGAPFVVVGAVAAEGVALAGLPRRDEVVIVAADPDDAGVWERAVLIGARRVLVLPEDEGLLVGELADSVEASGTAPVIAVVGGRGGAGATTTAAALALTAGLSGHRSLLVDGDPLGGGIDLVLGAEDTDGLRWPDVARSRGRLGASALRERLPGARGVAVLSWDRGDVLTVAPEAMEAVLAAGRRGADLVVVDLPRHIDGATAAALAASAFTLLVVPAEVRAVAAAARVAASVAAAAGRIEVLVRGPAPSGLSPDVVAASLGLPLAGAIAEEPGLAVALERGDPPVRRGRGPLAQFCTGFVARLLGDGEAAA